jgi:hypothetical protein
MYIYIKDEQYGESIEIFNGPDEDLLFFIGGIIHKYQGEKKSHGRIELDNGKIYQY